MRFVSDYAAGGDRTNFTVYQLVNASAQPIDWASTIARCSPTFGTLVMYERQDFDLIEQAFQLRSQWPNVTTQGYGSPALS